MTAVMPGQPGHAETAAALVAWATDSCTRRPAALSTGVSRDMGLQTAQVHALLAVAGAVRDMTAVLSGAHDGLVEELRESRGALVDELTEVRSDLAVELDDMRADLVAELAAVCAALGPRRRWRLRRGRQAVPAVAVLPAGAAGLAADGGGDR